MTKGDFLETFTLSLELGEEKPPSPQRYIESKLVEFTQFCIANTGTSL